MEDNVLTIFAPIYLIGKKIGCWSCGTKMPAVALLAQAVEGAGREVCILTDIVAIPKDILGYIQKRVPTFQLRYSKTVQGKYYANTCPGCGMLSGDFFLHSEPGGPFFPTCEEEASRLYLTEVPFREPTRIRANYHVGTGDLILNHAKRIT